MNKKHIILVFLSMGVIIMTGCAENIPVEQCVDGSPYGFFGGIFHGIIAPFGLIAMLFKDDIGVFATNNDGFWYAFGFLIGSGGWGLLAGKKS